MRSTEPDGDADVGYLLRLTRLRHLTLVQPASLACFVRLSAVTLSKLAVHSVDVVDLWPLRFLPALRSLQLVEVESHVNLSSLASLAGLSKLSFHSTPAGCEITRLATLRVLVLSEASSVHLLPLLAHLSRLRFNSEGSSMSLAARVCDTVVQMPAMRALGLHAPCPPQRLLALTNLHTLSLGCQCIGTYDLLNSLQDLNQLSRLGLYGLDPCHIAALESSSLTSLYIETSHTQPPLAVPCMRALSGLAMLQLWVGTGAILLRGDLLPAQDLLIETVASRIGLLYIEVDCMRPGITHRSVSRLSFGKGSQQWTLAQG